MFLEDSADDIQSKSDESLSVTNHDKDEIMKTSSTSQMYDSDANSEGKTNREGR